MRVHVGRENCDLWVETMQTRRRRVGITLMSATRTRLDCDSYRRLLLLPLPLLHRASLSNISLSYAIQTFQVRLIIVSINKVRRVTLL